MTVTELIAELRKLPGELLVVHEGTEWVLPIDAVGEREECLILAGSMSKYSSPRRVVVLGGSDGLEEGQ